ncbi:MAG TPA: ATP-binding protein [Candidatus Binatia bacterium]|jgi:hypothetical protein|nr:ATP-binding protein [Candidatus Binatia bacterium]
MSDLDLADIRRLRESALALLSNQGDDIAAFLHQKDKLTFRRRPEQRSVNADVKVTTSCSCLMSLTLTRQFPRVYPAKPNERARRAFLRIFRASWKSAGLGLNNAFSTVLVIRTFGMLVQTGILEKRFGSTQLRRYKPLGSVNLRSIARWLAADISRFKINKYEPTAALLYWFVDGITRGGISIATRHWRSLCTWARNEFNHQRSLVVAGHEAVMDPIAMAMSACLCASLRKVVDGAKAEDLANCLRLLPSRIELEHSILTLFEHQAPSGIWRKYFPLFHYPKAGSNFCFTFEMLEAVLAEFGNPDSEQMDTSAVLKGLCSALDWCRKNRLTFSADGKPYNGWNSGGELDSLNDEKPESWATAVVHMFLWELQHVLAVKAQFVLLKQYGATSASLDGSLWDRLLDIDVHLHGLSRTRVKTVLERRIIRPAAKFQAFSHQKIEGRLSALLFGPPGTSKTRLTSALAAKLGWPLVLIDPSQFLNKGIEQIYSRAEEIFRDLRDLSGVVVLFDEMDALVRARGEKQPLDITSRFLTTSMLPKLAGLHDQGTLVFLFATNYQKDFDPAIKRPGRFDILLCVGPPPWSEKLRCIDRFLPKKTPSNAVKRIRGKLTRLVQSCDPAQRELLDLFTFQETQTFFEGITKNSEAGTKRILGLKPAQFKGHLKRFGLYITLRQDGDYYAQFEEDKKESRLQ